MRESRIVLPRNAGVAELADALDSKSSDRKIVWVRAPPPASPLKRFFQRESPVSSVKIRMRNDAHGNTGKRRLFVKPFVNRNAVCSMSS
jgi:hypothetical protein